MKTPEQRLAITTLGAPGSAFVDVYHRLLTLSWPLFLSFAVAGFLITNIFFASLYLALGSGAISGVRPGSLEDAFFFSVHTITTIGYGTMAPISTTSNVLVTIEAMAGLLAFAVLTGLVFARFSRPSARILFSQAAVVCQWQGQQCLMFRLANHRANSVVEASLKVVLLYDQVSPEGIALRRLVDLDLVRDSSPLFRLTWMAIHTIDDKSPLHGVNPQWLQEVDGSIIASVSGIDETLAQPVHAMTVWRFNDIRWNQRMVDIMSGNKDNRVIDYHRFHETEPE